MTIELHELSPAAAGFHGVAVAVGCGSVGVGLAVGEEDPAEWDGRVAAWSEEERGQGVDSVDGQLQWWADEAVLAEDRFSGVEGVCVELVSRPLHAPVHPPVRVQ